MAGRLSETAADVVDRLAGMRDELDERQQRLLAVLRFLTVFCVMAVPFYVVLHSGWEATVLRRFFARISAAVLSGIGIAASSLGTTVSTETLVVEVSRDSTGWKSVMAFTALVVAARRSLRWKLTGIVAGVAAIAVANVLRIVSMIYLVVVYGVPYELLHTVLWRWGLTGIVLGLWVLWLWQTPDEE